MAERHDAYLAAAKAKYAGDEQILAAIEKSEEEFEAYKQAECSPIYSKFGAGSIRTSEAILCGNDLIARRTHTIWRNWLTYPDSTPPDLPEPSPTR